MAHFLEYVFRMGPVPGEDPIPIERFEAFGYGEKADPIACRTAF